MEKREREIPAEIKSERRKMNYAIFGHGDCMRYDVTHHSKKKRKEKKKIMCLMIS